jgi:aminopeptidase-like protein
MTATSYPTTREPSDGPAEDIRRLVDEFNPQMLGAEMHALVRQLYPICRSITGEGLRHSLRMLQVIAPIELREVPTGTAVFDWVVPREWNLRAARLTGPDGEVILDADRLNLHVLNYSAPFRGKVSLEELEQHLYSLPDRPSDVPYRTSYYKEDWGFCLSHEQRARLRPGEYDVLIDTSLTNGSLTYGEVVLRGTLTDEVLVSAHSCHPSLANDNLSGMALAATLARILSGIALRYTYRFVFAPATIGAITWLALNEERARRIAHGLVAACVGDAGRLTYKRSRRGDAEIDRAAVHVLAHCGQDYEVRDFSPYGYDERQYCSPAFDLAVGSLTRTPFGEYPEYHTSSDHPDLVRPDSLADSLRRYLEVFEVLEGNHTYVNLAPKGEPQLGKRGLYGSVGGQSHTAASQMAMLWVLNLSDGSRSLLDIAERSRLPFTDIRRAARALEAGRLLRVSGASSSVNGDSITGDLNSEGEAASRAGREGSREDL